MAYLTWPPDGHAGVVVAGFWRLVQLRRISVESRQTDPCFDKGSARDRPEAASRLAQNTENERRACEIRLRAERKAGKLLKKRPKRRGLLKRGKELAGGGPRSSHHPQLSGHAIENLSLDLWIKFEVGATRIHVRADSSTALWTQKVTSMRTLFEQIITEGEKALEELRDIRQQENVEFEFKTKSHPQNGDLTKDDRRNLSQALSALSNSMGGLLVWGVRARKEADDVDCATALVPISQIEKFQSLLERAVSQAIMPRHEGIRLPQSNPRQIPAPATSSCTWIAQNADRTVPNSERNSISRELEIAQSPWVPFLTLLRTATADWVNLTKRSRAPIVRATEHPRASRSEKSRGRK
jgi:hypothetical protein